MVLLGLVPQLVQQQGVRGQQALQGADEEVAGGLADEVVGGRPHPGERPEERLPQPQGRRRRLQHHPGEALPPVSRLLRRAVRRGRGRDQGREQLADQRAVHQPQEVLGGAAGEDLAQDHDQRQVLRGREPDLEDLVAEREHEQADRQHQLLLDHLLVLVLSLLVLPGRGEEVGEPGVAEGRLPGQDQLDGRGGGEEGQGEAEQLGEEGEPVDQLGLHEAHRLAEAGESLELGDGEEQLEHAQLLEQSDEAPQRAGHQGRGQERPGGQGRGEGCQGRGRVLQWWQ